MILKCETLEFDELILMPMQLSIVDSVLLLLSIKTERFVHKFNINSLKKIGESVPFGNGPNEMIDARKIQVVDSSIWLFDKMVKKIYQYNFLQFCSSDNPEVMKTVNYTIFLDDISILSKNKFVATTLGEGDNCKSRLYFFDMEGNGLFEKGELPDDGTEKTDLENTQGALCSIIINQFEKKIGLVYKLTDLIEIYDIDGNLLKRTHGPDQFFSQLRQHNAPNGAIRAGSVKGKTRDAYFSPVCYNNELWVLYSGRSYEPNKGNYLINTIIVFDWDGNPLRRYKLDTPVFAFTIDEKNKKIYAITDDPEFHIIRFDL